MAISLTPQQREAINADPGAPVSLVDEVTRTRYFLLSEQAYLHLQGLAEQNESQCHDQLQRLIQEGIDSPTVAADEAFDRLRSLAARLAQARP